MIPLCIFATAVLGAWAVGASWEVSRRGIQLQAAIDELARQKVHTEAAKHREHRYAAALADREKQLERMINAQENRRRQKSR